MSGSTSRREVIGFALSGGGARVATQVGVLRALSEAGVKPSLVAGTSAGAVNAAWMALYPGRLDRLHSIWMELRMIDVFPGGPLRLLMNMARRGYLHHAAAWEAFLRRDIGSAAFTQTVIPLAVTAVRLTDGECVVLDAGEIVPALMATTAIPGVFPPFLMDGEWYVDGGVLEYLPVPTLLARGATTIYALDASGFPRGFPDRGNVVDRSGLIASAAAARHALSQAAARGCVVHHLRPPTLELRDGRDVSRSAEMIESGYEYATEYLRDPPLGRVHPDPMR